MDIYQMDFIRLLPAFMQEDDADIGLSNAVNQATEEIAARVKLLSTWDTIDQMGAAELDLLADELNIAWYDPNASVEIKREIIKDSDLVHSRLGTNWAAMQVISTYFGAGKIIEWYEYGGKPFHFKVQIANQTVLSEQAEAFYRILNQVKRKSAVLDTIEILNDGAGVINYKVGSAIEDRLITYVTRT